jgi:hypothetical protein
VKNEQLATQIEMYSNAILGFLVVQAIGFSFSFGTNEFFNCTVKTAQYLAHGLAIQFIVVTLVSCYAMYALGRTLLRLSTENFKIVRTIFVAKSIAVVIFTTLPLVLTLAYGVADYPSKFECKKAKQQIAHCTAALPNAPR